MAAHVVAMLWVAALGVSAEVCVPDKVNEFHWEGCPPPWPPTYDMPAYKLSQEDDLLIRRKCEES